MHQSSFVDQSLATIQERRQYDESDYHMTTNIPNWINCPMEEAIFPIFSMQRL